MADPCGDALDPPVGGDIDAVAEAIANLPEFTASPIESLTVNGHDARELTVIAPARGRCNLQSWITPSRTNGIGGGEANLLRIYDIDGVTFMVAGVYYPLDTTDRSVDEQLALVRSVIESVRIGE